MNIVVFEDNKYKNFYPLSLTRPVWELRTGCFTIRERIENFIARNLDYFKNLRTFYYTREYLAPFHRTLFDININNNIPDNNGDDIFMINSRVIPGPELIKLSKNTIILHDGDVLAAHLDAKYTTNINFSDNTFPGILIGKDEIIKIEHKDVNKLKKLEYIWDIISINPSLISDDFLYFTPVNKNKGKDVTIIGDRGLLYVDDNVTIDPYTVIDLTSGPVVIGKGAYIGSFSSIEGPCYIGKMTNVNGAKIGKGCSFGDYCKISGEVSDSVFQGYSNKSHDGFIGHSYIGEWVNLGAMTTNSDLKNDYTEVKVYIPEMRIPTGNLKVGCFIGDFTKTSIGTLINTGASIGTGCMLVHAGNLTPYYIPSFSWYSNNSLSEKTNLDHFLKSCERITSRRNVSFSKEYEDLLRHVYKITGENRNNFIEKWKKTVK